MTKRRKWTILVSVFFGLAIPMGLHGLGTDPPIGYTSGVALAYLVGYTATLILLRFTDPNRMALVGIAVMQVWLAPLDERADGAAVADDIMLQLRRIYCIDPERGDLAAA